MKRSYAKGNWIGLSLSLPLSPSQLAAPSNPRAWTLRLYDPDDDSLDEGMGKKELFSPLCLFFLTPFAFSELTGNQPIKNFMMDKHAAFALCRNAAFNAAT
jgi:hypothetical protein